MSEHPTRNAIIRDFATLFAYLWYRDFPLHPALRGQGQRADWTTHIGITVRSTADLLGFFTHFESGGRTDAILRDGIGRPVAAIEWEWLAIHRGDSDVNEFEKLNSLCRMPGYEELQFAVLIGYARHTGKNRSQRDFSTATKLAF